MGKRRTGGSCKGEYLARLLKFIYNKLFKFCFVITNAFYPDVDECVTKLHDCHVSAYCVNTAGSYNCSCNQSGYSYNGSMCVGMYIGLYTVCQCLNYDTLSNNFYSKCISETAIANDKRKI